MPLLILLLRNKKAAVAVCQGMCELHQKRIDGIDTLEAQTAKIETMESEKASKDDLLQVCSYY